MAISVVINTYNAAPHLEKAVRAAEGFNEILVCDMGSTDNTKEVAANLGCRVISHPDGYQKIADPARNFAIRAARSQWVLVIDADELLNPILKEYLQEFIKDPGDVKGIYIPRKNYLFHIWKRSTYPDYQLRFFYRDAADWPSELHSQPDIDGKVIKIPSTREDLAIHHTSPRIIKIVEHLNRYTTAEVEESEFEHITFSKILFRPFMTFMESYFVKGAWRYGIAGFVSSCNDSVYRYVRLAKRFELELDRKEKGENETDR